MAKSNMVRISKELEEYLDTQARKKGKSRVIVSKNIAKTLKTIDLEEVQL